MIGVPYSWRWLFSSACLSYLLDGLFAHIGCQRYGLLQHLELPQNPDQPHGGIGGSGIGGLQLALFDQRTGSCVWRQRRVGGPEIIGALFGETGAGWKIDHL